MTTIRDVAELAQVSVGTVSRVLNHHPSVRPAMRRAVLTAIEELQYKPNPIARTLRTSKTRTLGMVIPGLSVAAGLAGAEVAAQEHGYALLVADSRFDLQIEARNIRSLLERRVDGLLCNPVESSRIIHDLVHDSGVPAVIWAWVVPNRVLPTAVMREKEAIKAAVEHLVEEGHRRISVLVSGGPLGTGSNIRQRLIHEAIEAHGIEADGKLDRVAPTSTECAAVVHELLRRPQRPTAFIIAARFAPAVIQAVREAGASIPHDLSIVWFGDSQWAKLIDPPLNVIALDLAAHGAAAMRLLVGLVEGEPDLPRSIEHWSVYVRRGSVGPVPSRLRDEFDSRLHGGRARR